MLFLRTDESERLNQPVEDRRKKSNKTSDQSYRPFLQLSCLQGSTGQKPMPHA